MSGNVRRHLSTAVARTFDFLTGYARKCTPANADARREHQTSCMSFRQRTALARDEQSLPQCQRHNKDRILRKTFGMTGVRDFSVFHHAIFEDADLCRAVLSACICVHRRAVVF